MHRFFDYMLKPEAAWHFHIHKRDGFDAVILQDLSQLINVKFRIIKLGTAYDQ